MGQRCGQWLSAGRSHRPLIDHRQRELQLSQIQVSVMLPESITGNATHNLTLYRDDSGALVFSAGTIFWARCARFSQPARCAGRSQRATGDGQSARSDGDTAGNAAIGPRRGGLVHRSHGPQATIAPVTGLIELGSKVVVSGTAADVGVVWSLASNFPGMGQRRGTRRLAGTIGAIPGLLTRLDWSRIEARGVDDSLNIGDPTEAPCKRCSSIPSGIPGLTLATTSP